MRPMNPGSYINDEPLLDHNSISAPSRQDIAKLIQGYLSCDDKNVISSFLDECMQQHDKLKLPTYDQTQNYATLKQLQFAVLKTNLNSYKYLQYLVNNLKDQHETLKDDSETVSVKEKSTNAHKKHGRRENQQNKARKKHERRTYVEYKDEKNNFCYIQNCSRSYTTQKALNLHIRKHHKKNEPHKNASDYINLQKTNPKTYLKKYNISRVKLVNVFKQEVIAKRLSSIKTIAEDNKIAVSKRATKKLECLNDQESFIGKQFKLINCQKFSNKRSFITKKDQKITPKKT